MLDQGGKPTVRELLSSLIFNPVDGTIRLNGQRIVMQRAQVGIELRHAMVRLLGEQEARIFLMRLGFATGKADARFVRTGWPNLDIGDAFTAGTRLHTFSGIVRVETVYNEFDFRKKRFAGEFKWHDSVEASEYRGHHKQADAPVCWTQLGYASGYASEFFDTLVIYKEVECSAEGHRHCRVIGKPADVWGPGDPEVILFRERIAADLDEAQVEPRRALAARAAETTLSELDRVVLAPVRRRLERFAPMALPVLIEGEAGTGRSRAARYLQRASGSPVEPRQLGGEQVTLETCEEIARPTRRGRREPVAETLLIDGIEGVPADLQPRLARALEEGQTAGGPRVIALAGSANGAPPLISSLAYALSVLTVRMPSLHERGADRLAIAHALITSLAQRMRRQPPRLDPVAAGLIEQNRWPGNLRQMRSVIGAALAAHDSDGPLTASEIDVEINRDAAAFITRANTRPRAWVDEALSQGISMAAIEGAAYETAVAKANGNLSAAARLLGLTRAQLAYRLKVRAAAEQAAAV
jgi:DNA-binding NtrC family response regulator/predicted hydrocarbon binding protein